MCNHAIKLFPLLICENYKKHSNYSKIFFLAICRKLLVICYSKFMMLFSSMDDDMMSLNHLESDQMCYPLHIAIKVKDISYLSI